MKNQPYNVLRHTQRDRAPKDPITLFTFATQTLGFSTIGGILFAGIATIGITLVTSAILRALAPKPPSFSAGSQGILVNSREPNAAQQFVYGEVRKGGTITYIEATGDKNEYLHQIIVLAGHPVEEIGNIYINDEVVTIDGSGNVTDAFLDEEDQPTIRIQKFSGSQTTAPTDLIAESNNSLGSNFIGDNIAYLYVRMKYNASAFPNGIPLFTAVVKGKKVHDPRTNGSAWTDNAALCIRDYLTSSYGLDDDKIDDTAFSAAANICDETVALAASGTVKRYTVNGVVNASQSHNDVLGDMVTACGGSLFWGAGLWKLTVADYIAPTKTLTLDDLRSGISVQTRNNLRDQFNIVQGTFINKDARWITEDYPPIVGSGFIAEDNGVEQALDLELPFTTDSATAQRIAKLTLYRGREQKVISAEFGMNAFDVEVGEIIQLTIPRYGWTNQEFEVQGWQLKPSEDNGDIRIALTLREISEAAFDWNAEESDIIGGGTILPDQRDALAIVNLTASDNGRLQGDGTFVNSVILNWDDVNNAFLDYYEVEWRVLTDTDYQSTTTEQSSIELSPVVDGVTYFARIRAVTVSGIRGPYAEIQFTAGGDETAPAIPTNISATGHFKYITIKWTNPTDLDLSHVDIYEGDDTNSASAVKVGTSSGDSFQRTNLGLNVTKYYFLKSVDYYGNESDFSTPVSATTTYLDDPDFENGIYTLFKDQGLYAIRDVDNLPVAGAFSGEKVFNRADGKLYTWNGTAWEATVSDVGAGSITETEIADNAISTPKLKANAVVASKIQGSTITGDKIVANTITGGLLATSGIITNSAQINDALITNAKITNAAVDTLKIGGEAVTTLRISGPLNSGIYTLGQELHNMSFTPSFSGDVIIMTGGRYTNLTSDNSAIIELRLGPTTVQREIIGDNQTGNFEASFAFTTTAGVPVGVNVYNAGPGRLTPFYSYLAIFERYR